MLHDILRNLQNHLWWTNQVCNNLLSTSAAADLPMVWAVADEAWRGKAVVYALVRFLFTFLFIGAACLPPFLYDLPKSLVTCLRSICSISCSGGCLCGFEIAARACSGELKNPLARIQTAYTCLLILKILIPFHLRTFYNISCYFGLFWCLLECL